MDLVSPRRNAFIGSNPRFRTTLGATFTIISAASLILFAILFRHDFLYSEVNKFSYKALSIEEIKIFNGSVHFSISLPDPKVSNGSFAILDFNTYSIKHRNCSEQEFDKFYRGVRNSSKVYYCFEDIMTSEGKVEGQRGNFSVNIEISSLDKKDIEIKIATMKFSIDYMDTPTNKIETWKMNSFNVKMNKIVLQQEDVLFIKKNRKNEFYTYQFEKTENFFEGCKEKFQLTFSGYDQGIKIMKLGYKFGDKFKNIFSLFEIILWFLIFVNWFFAEYLFIKKYIQQILKKVDLDDLECDQIEIENFVEKTFTLSNYLKFTYFPCFFKTSTQFKKYNFLILKVKSFLSIEKHIKGYENYDNDLKLTFLKKFDFISEEPIFLVNTKFRPKTLIGKIMTFTYYFLLVLFSILFGYDLFHKIPILTYNQSYMNKTYLNKTMNESFESIFEIPIEYKNQFVIHSYDKSFDLKQKMKICSSNLKIQTNLLKYFYICLNIFDLTFKSFLEHQQREYTGNSPFSLYFEDCTSFRRKKFEMTQSSSYFSPYSCLSPLQKNMGGVGFYYTKYKSEPGKATSQEQKCLLVQSYI